ncbi:UNVERIFIED_CONTAM: hypothetical protein HHA_453310 [Hammondia hammondi]|eukprot:XP_008886590.1 hypothetical protein HHA_453310 [Hammondia hammondi]
MCSCFHNLAILDYRIQERLGFVASVNGIKGTETAMPPCRSWQADPYGRVDVPFVLLRRTEGCIQRIESATRACRGISKSKASSKRSPEAGQCTASRRFLSRSLHRG